MRTTTGLLLALLIIGVAPTATTAGRDLETDHFVRLYRTRVRYAETHKRRAIARLNYAKARYDRVRKLYESNAASREDLDEASAAHQMNVELVAEMDVRMEEAQTLLDLCRARILAGKEMPIFPVSSSGLDAPSTH